MAVGLTSVEVLGNAWGKRTMFVITNTDAAAVVTICKGVAAAEADAGIRLLPSGYYFESNESGFECWQGPIQVIADAGGTVSVVETFRD
jgi:hypothetical protein